MSFKHLAEFSSLTQPEAQPILEAKTQASDFDGIRSVVEDSLADLHDKVAALMTLAKESGASKLDTVKDADGLTVFKKIDKLTKEYKKAMDKLMTEAEAMVMQVAEGTKVEGTVLTEGKNDYEDSADFTGELHEVGGHILNIKKVTRQPRWKNWMKSTDQNFDTSCEGLAADFEEKLKALDKSFDALEDELTSAS